jgi:DNA-binding SARP family transcriptional activator
MRQTRRWTLHVHLLGRLEVRTSAGRIVTIRNRHAQALFALLVLSGRQRAREAIAVDLWPESDGSSCTSLRQAVWLLRTALAAAGVAAEHILDLDGETLGIRPDAIPWRDVTAFQEQARGDDAALRAAVSAYTGDLLEGLTHECFASERERLSDLYEDALAKVAIGSLATGDIDDARIAAESLVARDPLREEAHAVLIAVHGRTGSRSQVVRQYRRLRTLLADELDVGPLPETEMMYRMALDSTIARSAERAATMGDASPGLIRISA